MDYLVSVIQSDPLTIHFSFHQPEDSESPAYVPRLLTPLGYFVSVKVTDAKDEVIYESDKPKIKLKLKPDKPESYQALEPGYTYGCVFMIDEFSPPSGTYHATISYSNQGFRGFEGHSLGEMNHTAKITFRVS